MEERKPYGFTIQEKNIDEETNQVSWTPWKDHIYKTENYANGALKISRKVTTHGIDAEYRVLPLFTEETI